MDKVIEWSIEQINELENAVLSIRNDMLELLKGKIDHEQRIQILENKWKEMLKDDEPKEEQIKEEIKKDKN